MAYMDWDKGLETGIEIIDNQHKKLISLVNDLHGAMKGGKGRLVIGDTLEELATYTVYHFGTEEKAFDRYSYPETAAHKFQHAELIRQVGELMASFKKGELTITIDTLQFLTDWVRTHIRQEDMAYVPFLIGKEI